MNGYIELDHNLLFALSRLGSVQMLFLFKPINISPFGDTKFINLINFPYVLFNFMVLSDKSFTGCIRMISIIYITIHTI